MSQSFTKSASSSRSVLVLLALLLGLSLSCKESSDTSSRLTIATVNNADMIIMQDLSTRFEVEHGIELEWVILEENVLRQRVTTDIATGSGQFDIVTIGAYETPIWGRQGWLVGLDELTRDPDYDAADLLPTVRDSLSVDGTLYAVPFYAESSFTFYRKDLFEEAGLVMPEQPSYEDIEKLAAALHRPEKQQYGICLRGKAGWGENMAFVGTLVNTFGGRWFDMEWRPEIDSAAWREAVSFYVKLLKNYGPPGSSSNGHNECRALFTSGHCAIWIDATSAAGAVFDPRESRVAGKVGFTRAPIARVPNGAAWSWSWALAIPSASKKAELAKRFLSWATSRRYVRLVGETHGWTVVPPATRRSTYEQEEYLAAAPFANFTLEAVQSADPTRPCAKPVPYVGVQFVSIPEFQAIGTQVGQSISAALAGQVEVVEALSSAQKATERTMRRAGYFK